MNILLCGLPLSGKTTVGQTLAQRLNWNFIDTDRLIEQAYFQKNQVNYSCRQIYKQEGEKKFRALEAEQILHLKQLEQRIVALGGGSLNLPHNRQLVKQLGQVIYLEVSPELLWERMQRRDLPAYLDPKDPEQAFYLLAKKRIPFYETVAHLKVQASHLNEQLAAEAVFNYWTTHYGK